MSPDAVESALLAHYRAASPDVKRRGRQWYGTAECIMRDLAAETGYTLEQAVAVLAITSPGAQLRTNIDWTERVLRGEVDTAGRFPNANRPKIAHVLADPGFAQEYVTGPKVSAFHRAILGDTSALVLDRWAIYAATGRRANDDVKRFTSTKLRAGIEAGYRRAARKVRMNVRDFQALVWLQARETTPRLQHGKYVPVRFADITT